MEYQEIEGRMPEKVFRYFKEISRIPRGSGNTAAAAKYCVRFAGERGLSCRADGAGNVVILKEASPGCGQAPSVMLQGHLDMVCVAAPGVSHDFEREGLELFADGDYIRAAGTTLGADDGIAVALMLAVLDSEELRHPRLECVFTAGEEIGMTGASALDMSGFRAKYLLNLDSEEEGVFLSGCAGGVRCDLKIPVCRKTAGGVQVKILLSGLSGGHSGTDIGKGRANGILLLARLLDGLLKRFPDLQLLEAKGGDQDNAIPSAASMTAAVREEELSGLLEETSRWERTFRDEFSVSDPGLTLRAEALGEAEGLEGVSGRELKKLSAFLLCLPNGVEAMSQELEGFTETSLNFGVLSLTGTSLSASCLVRSLRASGKEALCRRLEALAWAFSGEAVFSGDYPAWEYREDSALRPLLCRVYEEQYGSPARTETIHAGVECGLFAAGIPGLDAVSMGPEILDIHMPSERLSISSTDRFWNFLTEVLKRLADA